MAVTLEWVFLSSLLSFLFDSTPQTSLGEEKWTTVAQGIEIYYQLKREQQTVSGTKHLPTRPYCSQTKGNGYHNIFER